MVTIGVGTHIAYRDRLGHSDAPMSKQYCFDKIVAEVKGKPNHFITELGIKIKVSTGGMNWGDLVFAGRHKPIYDDLTHVVMNGSVWIAVYEDEQEAEGVKRLRREQIEAAWAKRDEITERMRLRKAEYDKATVAYREAVAKNDIVRRTLEEAEAIVWRNTMCKTCIHCVKSTFCAKWEHDLTEEPTSNCSAWELKK